MSLRGPALTLLAVVAVGLSVLLVNVSTTPPDPAAAVAAQPPPTGVPPGAPPTAAVPEPAAAVEQAPEAAVDEVVYAGRSSGDEVTVAIAVAGGRAVAYVCDGDRIEAWLEGTLDGDRLSLRGPDGAAVEGSVTEGAALGTVTVAGGQWPYSAQAATAPAGLYEGRADVRGVVNRIGWVVLPDGTQTGVVSGGGETGPAPRLDPGSPDGVTLDGAPVQVRSITGADPVVG